jgi:spore coat protein U-like protein
LTENQTLWSNNAGICGSRKRAMTSHARHFLLVLAGCGAICASPARAVTQNASVKATVVKPLTLSSLQNLDLGTITLQPGVWSGATVGISRNGVLSCGNSDVICSGLAQPASYKVTGSNKQVVLISAPAVTLVNQSDPTQTLSMIVDNPGQVMLTSSGEPGITFNLGGSIKLDSTTATGTYSGTFNVTVDYQ